MDCRKLLLPLCGSLLFMASDLALADGIRISNLANIRLNFTAGYDSVGSSPACIYHSGAGSYSLIGRGSGAGGAFQLGDGATNTLPYEVSFDDGAGLQTLSPDIPLTNLMNANTTSPSCADSGNNGSIDIRISALIISSVPAGNYSGTLTLVVAPE